MLPIRRDNWDTLTTIPREFDRFWRDFMGSRALASGTYPVDIDEDDNEITVEAELPGFTQDEIDVTVDNGVLRIVAERQPKDKEERGTSHLSERQYTRVERSFNLPTSIDESHVEAQLDGGVLHLRLPKSEEVKPRRIQIK